MFNPPLSKNVLVPSTMCVNVEKALPEQVWERRVEGGG
jgi:hypothetical protein